MVAEEEKEQEEQVGETRGSLEAPEQPVRVDGGLQELSPVLLWLD